MDTYVDYSADANRGNEDAQMEEDEIVDPPEIDATLNTYLNQVPPEQEPTIEIPLAPADPMEEDDIALDNAPEIDSALTSYLNDLTKSVAENEPYEQEEERLAQLASRRRHAAVPAHPGHP